ncbi:cilia- and flagella-associated protein 161-like [Neodiprion fabricii]|uniref:cilia- and flagella-associated protein 161-like n=1 Tax=Neodiprion fabricii TaxID=2872261 RepID=UPI001ED8F0B8|nr:cilia- and flagella-associated protein 161-like [Neodiprion fabricii]
MYSSNVRCGNWTENIALSEEKLKLYVMKRDREELLVQHTRKVFANVFREVQLAKPGDFITFGSCVQLQAPDMPGFPPRSKYSNYGVVLAGTMNERDIDTAHHFLDGCSLVCSPVLIPCVRNTFVIKPADCHHREGDNLMFDQAFLLQLIESGREPLYVRAETPTVSSAHGPMEHNPVMLSNNPDCYAKWKVLYWDPNMRFETAGAPFPPSTRVVICHVMTGLCLAVEYCQWYLTIFGPDCGVSVHTYADVHRRETAECLWMFVTEKSSSENTECPAGSG